MVCKPTMEVAVDDAWEFRQRRFLESFFREKGCRALGFHGLGNLESTKPATLQ